MEHQRHLVMAGHLGLGRERVRPCGNGPHGHWWLGDHPDRANDRDGQLAGTGVGTFAGDVRQFVFGEAIVGHQQAACFHEPSARERGQAHLRRASFRREAAGDGAVGALGHGMVGWLGQGEMHA